MHLLLNRVSPSRATVHFDSQVMNNDDDAQDICRYMTSTHVRAACITIEHDAGMLDFFYAVSHGHMNV